MDMADCIWTYPSIKGVKKRVSGSVSYTAASVSLASLPVLETLAAKSPLVDSPIFSAAERHAKVLQLEKSNSEKQRDDNKLFNSRWCLFHVAVGGGSHDPMLAKSQRLGTSVNSYDRHNFSPPQQQRELAQSCSEWHPGLRANQIPSLCHRNATSSHPPPCCLELH